MAIPLTLGGGPRPWITPADIRGLWGSWGSWGRRWRGLLAAVAKRHRDQREPDPTPLPRLAALSADRTADDRSAFVDLFAAYHVPLLDYLFGMTRDRELAADLTQDTFVRAFTAAPTLAGIAAPRAWLYQIATHVALNAIRHRGHFEWLPLSRIPPEEDGGPAERAWDALPPVQLPPTEGDLATSVAERAAIWSVLAELPGQQRAALLLQAAAGFEVREIAALLNLSEANVHKCLFRAKERFRTRYRQLDAGGGES
jgi:RNA polymerase sigma-70 factor (ECF subfamily)